MAQFITRTWRGDPAGSGTHDDRRSFAYEAFVPDAIGSLRLDLPADTAEAVVAAQRALDELQLGTQFLGLESLSRQLLRAESVASSRIEGLSLSQRRLAEAIWDPDTADRNARAVLGNIDAMDRAIQLGASVEAIGVDELRQIHAALFAETRESPPGVIRTKQNWIGGSPNSPRGAEFIPPPEDMVHSLLEDLAAFLKRDDMPSIVQAGIAHAQFETIHPFGDGNGRVGRALIHVVLRRRGAATRFVPPISIVLAANARRYVQGLTAFRNDRPMDWLHTFALVVESAVAESRRLASGLEELQLDWYRRAGAPRVDSTASRTLGLLPGRPIVNAASLTSLLRVSSVAARNALNALESAGILSPVVVGRKRNRAWQAPEIIALLDNFEWSMAEPTRVGEPRVMAPRPRG